MQSPKARPNPGGYVNMIFLKLTIISHQSPSFSNCFQQPLPSVDNQKSKIIVLKNKV